ncbi:MAG TPA: response regulator transcription factor [Opitutus sp.]|nr:response regulator transcription factor [Opitutus sp.]
MKILVIEDHHLVRDMLVATCDQVVGGAEARGAGSGAEGVSVSRGFGPDLVFLDLVLPDGDGLDFIPALRQIRPDTKIIALTSHPDEVALHRAQRASVNGFVDKNEQPLAVLKEAIHTVMRGQPYFSSVAQRLRAAMHRNPAEFSKVLSEHEQSLLALFGEGLSNEDVGRRLGLAAGTVRNHRSHIMSKLDIHSTPELMRYAIEKGFTRVRRW